MLLLTQATQGSRREAKSAGTAVTLDSLPELMSLLYSLRWGFISSSTILCSQKEEMEIGYLALVLLGFKPLSASRHMAF